MRLRRLHPEPAEIDSVEAVAGLAGQDRLAVNMVVSADGRAAFEGKTAPLSDPADRELFHVLRSQADAILVGPGTLREERYGPFTKSERFQALREQAGARPAALGVTITRSLDLPYDIPLFQDPGSHVVVYTSHDREPEDCPARVDVIRMTSLDPPAIVADLRERYDVRCVLSEGGPRLNGPLFAARAVDELFLTISPALMGGIDVRTIVEGVLPETLRLDLAQVVEHEGTLMLRYRMRRDG